MIVQHLAVGSVAPGDDCANSEPMLRRRLAVRIIPPGGTCSEESFVALCAWRYAAPARRSGNKQCLAARVPAKRFILLQL